MVEQASRFFVRVLEFLGGTTPLRSVSRARTKIPRRCIFRGIAYLC